MVKHFANLHKLAASNVYLHSANAAPEKETFQWYVLNIDSFIISVDVEKLRKTFGSLHVTAESEAKLDRWLNSFSEIWDEWTGRIHIGFDTVYNLAVESNSDILLSIEDFIIPTLEELKDDPENELLKRKFLKYVKTTNTDLNYIRLKLDSLIKDLNSFLNSFDEQQKIFTSICEQICEEQHIKKGEIEEINKMIADYKNRIEDLKKTIIALGVVDGIGVIASIGAIIGAFFSGGITLSLLVPFLPVVGATSAMIAVYRKEIADFNGKIKNKEKAVKGLTDDITGLIAFSETIKDISQRDSTIEEYVRKAKEPWVALSEDLKKILADINVASNADSSIYNEYLVAFQEAKQLWVGTFMPEISKLKLEDIKVVTTPEGFSIENTADWEEALNKYSVSIEEFFNRNIA